MGKKKSGKTNRNQRKVKKYSKKGSNEAKATSSNTTKLDVNVESKEIDITELKDELDNKDLMGSTLSEEKKENEGGKVEEKHDEGDTKVEEALVDSNKDEGLKIEEEKNDNEVEKDEDENDTKGEEASVDSNKDEGLKIEEEENDGEVEKDDDENDTKEGEALVDSSKDEDLKIEGEENDGEVEKDDDENDTKEGEALVDSSKDEDLKIEEEENDGEVEKDDDENDTKEGEALVDSSKDEGLKVEEGKNDREVEKDKEKKDESATTDEPAKKSYSDMAKKEPLSEPTHLDNEDTISTSTKPLATSSTSQPDTISSTILASDDTKEGNFCSIIKNEDGLKIELVEDTLISQLLGISPSKQDNIDTIESWVVTTPDENKSPDSNEAKNDEENKLSEGKEDETIQVDYKKEEDTKPEIKVGNVFHLLDPETQEQSVEELDEAEQKADSDEELLERQKDDLVHDRAGNTEEISSSMDVESPKWTEVSGKAEIEDKPQDKEKSNIQLDNPYELLGEEKPDEREGSGADETVKEGVEGQSLTISSGSSFDIIDSKLGSNENVNQSNLGASELESLVDNKPDQLSSSLHKDSKISRSEQPKAEATQDQADKAIPQYQPSEKDLGKPNEQETISEVEKVDSESLDADKKPKARDNKSEAELKGLESKMHDVSHDNQELDPLKDLKPTEVSEKKGDEAKSKLPGQSVEKSSKVQETSVESTDNISIDSNLEKSNPSASSDSKSSIGPVEDSFKAESVQVEIKQDQTKPKSQEDVEPSSSLSHNTQFDISNQNNPEGNIITPKSIDFIDEKYDHKTESIIDRESSDLGHADEVKDNKRSEITDANQSIIEGDRPLEIIVTNKLKEGETMTVSSDESRGKQIKATDTKQTQEAKPTPKNPAELKDEGIIESEDKNKKESMISKSDDTIKECGEDKQNQPELIVTDEVEVTTENFDTNYSNLESTSTDDIGLGKISESINQQEPESDISEKGTEMSAGSVQLKPDSSSAIVESGNDKAGIKELSHSENRDLGVTTENVDTIHSNLKFTPVSDIDLTESIDQQEPKSSVSEKEDKSPEGLVHPKSDNPSTIIEPGNDKVKSIGPSHSENVADERDMSPKKVEDVVEVDELKSNFGQMTNPEEDLSAENDQDLLTGVESTHLHENPILSQPDSLVPKPDSVEAREKLADSSNLKEEQLSEEKSIRSDGKEESENNTLADASGKDIEVEDGEQSAKAQPEDNKGDLEHSEPSSSSNLGSSKPKQVIDDLKVKSETKEQPDDIVTEALVTESHPKNLEDSEVEEITRNTNKDESLNFKVEEKHNQADRDKAKASGSSVSAEISKLKNDEPEVESIRLDSKDKVNDGNKSKVKEAKAGESEERADSINEIPIQSGSSEIQADKLKDDLSSTSFEPTQTLKVKHKKLVINEESFKIKKEDEPADKTKTELKGVPSVEEIPSETTKVLDNQLNNPEKVDTAAVKMPQNVVDQGTSTRPTEKDRSCLPESVANIDPINTRTSELVKQDESERAIKPSKAKSTEIDKESAAYVKQLQALKGSSSNVVKKEEPKEEKNASGSIIKKPKISITPAQKRIIIDSYKQQLYQMLISKFSSTTPTKSNIYQIANEHIIQAATTRLITTHQNQLEKIKLMAMDEEYLNLKKKVIPGSFELPEKDEEIEVVREDKKFEIDLNVKSKFIVTEKWATFGITLT